MAKQWTSKLIISEVEPGDIEEIKVIEKSAFRRDDEAKLVIQLMDVCSERISLVAKIEGHVCGHILFTPILVKSAKLGFVKGMGLGPLAVLLKLQKKGFGTALIKSGLAKVKESGYPFIVVLGHPAYYPRFGFEPAYLW